MDVCGNAIGHVSAIDPQVSDEPLPLEEKPAKPGKKLPKSPQPPPEAR
jgi:hypothetical protein